MSFAVRTWPGCSLVFTRLSEAVDLADSLNLLYTLTVNPGRLSGMRVLCDVHDAQVDLSFDDLCSITAFVRSHQAAFAGMRWGMVVSGTLNYGLARSAGLMTGDLPFEYEVFQSLELATNWLGITPAEWAAYWACEAAECSRGPGCTPSNLLM